MYHPVTSGGRDIYCHAKILIADGEVFRLGSSNMNNRSLRLDTECDLAIQARDDADRATIARLRDGLIAEHLDVERAEVERVLAETGSLIAVVERLRGSGKTLDPYKDPEHGALRVWLADNEVLDPEGPDEMFEPLARRGLFRHRHRLRKPRWPRLHHAR